MHLLHTAGSRLANVHAGATDVVPIDQQRMILAKYHLKECEMYAGVVTNGDTVRNDCPLGQVTGRYLVVQLDGQNYLTLCEVTAAAAAGMG